MKHHMMKPRTWHFDIDDRFRTWCGITDMDNPSEECMENFVHNWNDCTCKKCKQAYEKNTKEFERQQKEMNKALS